MRPEDVNPYLDPVITCPFCDGKGQAYDYDHMVLVECTDCEGDGLIVRLDDEYLCLADCQRCDYCKKIRTKEHFTDPEDKQLCPACIEILDAQEMEQEKLKQQGV